MTTVSQKHRSWAEGFTAVTEGVSDWDAPTPVAEWRARDVVRHLAQWLPGLLRSQGSTYNFGDLPSADEDPARTWRALRDAVQRLLDDPSSASEVLHTQMFGDLRADELVDRLYVPDVFMHTWDLARSSGQPHGLEEAESARMLAGLREIEDVIRSSGQFGDQQPVPADATPTEELMAFLGRDPRWTPPPRG